MNRINIRTAVPTDALLISELANKIWWQAYSTILSEEQIHFMLKEMYGPAFLTAKIKDGVPFYIAEMDGQACGFISALAKDNESEIYRIEKLYVLVEVQGLGIGKKLINDIAEIAKSEGFATLELNVNRNNPARHFYEKEGFKIIEEVDIPYHHFTLNDYIMHKNI